MRGCVQGVGFRPAICKLAARLGVAGFVRNDGEGVWIEVEGGVAAVQGFLAALPAAVPAPARIESLETGPAQRLGETLFRIEPSQAPGSVGARIPPDLGPCAACVRELEDPTDRRFRYPFINCTACGPRFSIVRQLPYDRARTTMVAFELCPRCRREYDDPADRRFHAEPNACPTCGPRLSLIVPGQAPLRGSAALAGAIALIRTGQIVAVKGAGGFVLAADAAPGSAVPELRQRKGRRHKPFAVLARDLATVRAVAQVDAASADALVSAARPIVLCPLTAGAVIDPQVAPGLAEVGFFLPPTPLQALLVQQGPALQVMTSGNLSEEPIARDNDEALVRLASLADAFLLHDREIHTRVDDSVVRVVAGRARCLRRARGFVPEPLPLPPGGPPLLAVGGQMKATVCLGDGARAYLSQHLGDLQDLGSFRFFQEAIDKLIGLVGCPPAAVVHDRHPDYRSTRWALAWAGARGLPLLAVQHHHAHVAACLAENGRSGPCLGVAFDGTGLGDDGQIWGGEFLNADLSGFQRLGHLQPLPLPGGETAIRQPWKLAAAALWAAGEPRDLLNRGPGAVPSHQTAAVDAVLKNPGRALALATSAGRWFDAVAALCGVGREVSYDGQAPAQLEAIAAAGPCQAYPFELRAAGAGPFVVDLRETIRAIAADLRAQRPVPIIAARFHETLARVIHRGCDRARAAGGPSLVALAGGCFANRILTERSAVLLEQDGFEVLLPRRVPPGDGGLSFGQAAVAAFRLRPGGAPCA